MVYLIDIFVLHVHFDPQTTFKGRVFMTHATKAIYRWLLSDYIKVRYVCVVILPTKRREVGDEEEGRRGKEEE